MRTRIKDGLSNTLSRQRRWQIRQQRQGLCHLCRRPALHKTLIDPATRRIVFRHKGVYCAKHWRLRRYVPRNKRT